MIQRLIKFCLAITYQGTVCVPQVMVGFLAMLRKRLSPAQVQKALQQLTAYRSASNMSFVINDPNIIDAAKDLPAWSWWRDYGKAFPELRQV